ncbi:L30e-like protein [Sporormia fimetaria CBS 119925]|uniref:L30e-like protein n=1 Tax=Sporormia fimetaria CBS 119925 TaxID=1340428 RepID=A0A6A6V989_9PLEO|nr:L30e-like protein [Sporormia fimetaria CBS 119925]
MGKDITDKKDKKKEKKETSGKDGVTKVKKEKKSKKSKLDGDVADALEAELSKNEDTTMLDASADAVMVTETEAAELTGAIVPFANPLAVDPKEVKKILRAVKKSAKTKTLRRGVKEVVKALRKSEISGPSSSDISNPSAIVVIAADISPMDVISHIPVLCEDHNIPYIYIKSRAELGESSATKRPTSVVMITKERNKKNKDIKDSDVEEFEAAYADLVKIVVKANKGVTK